MPCKHSETLQPYRIECRAVAGGGLAWRVFQARPRIRRALAQGVLYPKAGERLSPETLEDFVRRVEGRRPCAGGADAALHPA